MQDDAPHSSPTDTSALRPIERPRQVSEIVLERLRADIVTGIFKLGEKISETQIAAAYGVTKAPVRAAYMRLQAEGLVEIRPQSGTYVFSPDAKDIRALCELRVALELEALRLSMQRNRIPLHRQIAGLCIRMEAALAEGRPGLYADLDHEFHMAFFVHADSPHLRRTYEAQVANATEALRHRFTRDPAANDTSNSDHNTLRDLIGSGDPAAQENLLRRHIQFTRKLYADLLGV